MKLAGVFDNQEGYSDVKENLKDFFKVSSLYDIDRNDVFEEIKSIPGYAHCMYHGQLKQGVRLTELEVAMICDSGYSFFGGYSHIYDDGTFAVKIYTD